MDSLDLFLHETRLGTIRRGTSRSQVRVEWDAAYAESTRVSEAFGVIPGREPPMRAVSNFLGGYAPEGNQRTALAGALTVRVPEEAPAWLPRYDRLDSRKLGRALRRAIDEHDLGVRDDSRSMIPGFQPKLLAARLGGEWMLPHGRAHSTHILKPQLESRPQAILHEYWAHQVAQRMGLASHETELLRAGASGISRLSGSIGLSPREW